MALNSYAQLTLNGTALDGDTSVQHIGGLDVSSGWIEVFEVRWGSGTPTSAGGRAGRVEMQPVFITKRIDQTTPRLYEALARNLVLEGDIKLFDTHPDDGTTRHRFTLTITKGRVLSIASCSPDTLDIEAAGRPAREVVGFTAASLTYTDELASIEFVQDVVPR